MANEFKARNGVIAPKLILPGSTSGTVTIEAPATAGTQTLTLPSTSGNNNELLATNGSGTLSWVSVTTALGYTPYNSTNPNGYTTNTGTVTSVGLTLPNVFSVTGSPVTSSGTLTATLASQTANTVWAAPSGSAGTPTFRALVAADIPALTLENLPDAWVKRSVKVATTANITLSGTQTIDGIAVAAGDRVLVKNQTAQAENGIYVASATAWARAADANVSSELAAAQVGVDQGTTNGGFTFDTDFKSTDTLGTTAMTWSRVLDAGAIGSSVQAWDADLDAIAAISATSGLLKKTAANTWSLDTNTYITTDGTARVIVKNNGTAVGTRRGVNFIPGTNVTLTIAEDAANEEVDVTINASGGGSITLSDDTTTNATRYILFDDSTTGTQTAFTVSSTKLTFNPSTGVVTATGFSGPINGAVGGTTPAAGAFTTLSASSTVSGTGFSTYLASPPAIGGTAAAAGTFTTLTANGSTNNASLVLSSAALSSTAWTTTGIGIRIPARTYTDTSSVAGTVAASYIHSIAAQTFASTNAITITEAATLFVAAPAAGTNSTLTGNGFSIVAGGRIKASDFTGTIGATTASSGAFTTLSASSTVSGTGFSTYLASPPAIGGTTAAAGSFTTLSASSTVSGTGFSNYLASPPAIGGTAAAAGSFTTLTVRAANDLRLADSDSSNYVGFKSPATVSANVIWTLPSADGTNGQVLTTNGTGTLSWATAGSSVATYTTTVGNGSATSITVTHNLAKNDVLVAVREVSSGYMVYPDIKYSSTNAVILEFVTAPTTNQYRVSIVGF